MPVYCTGMSQPPNSTMRGPCDRWPRLDNTTHHRLGRSAHGLPKRRLQTLVVKERPGAIAGLRDTVTVEDERVASLEDRPRRLVSSWLHTAERKAFQGRHGS